LLFQRERCSLLLALRRYGPLGFWKKRIKSLVRINLRDNFQLSDLALLVVITGTFNASIWKLREKSNLFSHLLITWYIYNRAWYIGNDLREKFLGHLKMQEIYWNLTTINKMEFFFKSKEISESLFHEFIGEEIKVIHFIHSFFKPNEKISDLHWNLTTIIGFKGIPLMKENIYHIPAVKWLRNNRILMQPTFMQFFLTRDTTPWSIYAGLQVSESAKMYLR
jgi:hypothetical protein